MGELLYPRIHIGGCLEQHIYKYENDTTLPLPSIFSEQKEKKYSTSGEFILRPSLRLSPPSFHLPHHFVTDWDQGSSTFNRSNLGMSCKSIHCSVLGFAVG